MNASALALAAFLLSPRALAGMGNAVGLAGALALALLAGVAALHAWLGGRGSPFADHGPGAGHETRAMGAAAPGMAGFAWWLEGCAAVMLFPFWAASLLGVAGYAFNESFLHWFPNLGFSFLLLGLALAAAVLNAGMRAAAACGLAALAVTALLGAASLALGGPSPGPSGSAPGEAFPALACLAPVLLGARLAGQARQAVLASLAVMAVWALLFWLLLEPAYLAQATTPHFAAARVLLGPMGRQVAGAMVVLACLGGTAVMLRASAGWLSVAFAGAFAGARAWPWALALAGAEALALGLGYAGEPATEWLIAGGVAAWLAALATRCLALGTTGLVAGAGFAALAALSPWACPRSAYALAFAAAAVAAAALGRALFRKNVAA